MAKTPIWIRNVRIDPPVVLAPMEGVTDLTFRRLVRSIGGTGLTCTEFIPSAGLKRGSGKAWEMAQFDSDEFPVSIQIYGRDPEQMAEGARIVQDMGATICDINMGCPSKKVCAHSGGSSLMKDLKLATEIIRAARGALTIPLTVKMRSGFDASHRNAPELARICESEGVDGLAIHWRTREDRYGGERQVDKIAEAVDAVSIPVFGNGDIIDLDSAKAMLEDTGCAGVMVGRGAMRDPWLPLQISRWLGGRPPLRVGARERERVLLTYFDTISIAFNHSKKGALGRMKMISKQFTRPLPHGAGLRNRIFHSTSRTEAEGWVHRYFDLLEQQERSTEDCFLGTEFEGGEAQEAPQVA